MVTATQAVDQGVAVQTAITVPNQSLISEIAMEYRRIGSEPNGLGLWSVFGVVYFTGGARKPMDFTMSPVKAFTEELMVDVVRSSVNAMVVLGMQLGATLYKTNKRRRW